MLATIDAYNISVFIHVAAVVVGFGATYALALTFPIAMKVDPRHLPYVHSFSAAVGRMAMFGSLVILVTGISQVIDNDGIGFGDAWVSVTFAILIILGAMGGAYFTPSDRKLGAMVTKELAAAPPGAEVTLSEEYQRGARMQGIMGGLAGFLTLVAIFLMVTKPGA